ncbi:hypothetical protein BS78_05G062000 [Paspalum vaginatum]|nr:hypothetical protein BS78_05G062000 [Paspalum vaginatum]
MVGFTNQHGRWFEFGKRGATQPQLPGATLLGYSGNYQSLVGGSSQLPTAFKVGKYELVRAAKALWDHPHRANEDGGSDDDDDPMAPTPGVKTYLALLVFCLCEGARLPPVYDAVNAAWSTEAAGYIITHEHVVYINHWQQVSSALLGWKRHGNSFKWPKNVIDVGINGKDAGLLIVYLILNKPPTRMTTSVTAASRLLGFFGSLQALWRLLGKATGLF